MEVVNPADGIATAGSAYFIPPAGVTLLKNGDFAERSTSAFPG
jgi:hypothetical protein